MPNDEGPAVNHVVELSGGKDSTAMLLAMLERGERVHSIVFVDTGWDFPQIHDHLTLLERRTRRRIVRLAPMRPFEYFMFEKPITRAGGPDKGKVYRCGRGWPQLLSRWCNTAKSNSIDRYMQAVPAALACIGLAADEEKRRERITVNTRRYAVRYPLAEYDMTEADCLGYCRERGYDFGGLYEHLQGVSCFCCPYQSVGNLRQLYLHYPELWQRMLAMESRLPPDRRRFNRRHTVTEISKRFAAELRGMAMTNEE